MNNEKTCKYCGDTFSVEDGVQWGSYFYCDSCFKETKCNVDSYHHPSMEIKFRKLNDEDTKEFLGIELETTKDANGYLYNSDHKEDIWYIRKNFKNIGRSINWESDASIGNGKEGVFFPMTIGYIYDNKEELKDICKYLISRGNYAHDKGKCGLHIHVSMDALGDTDEEKQKTIEKIMLFVETYRDKVEKFSRRRHQQFSCYNAYTIPYHKEHYASDNFSDNYFKSGKLLKEINSYDEIGHSSVVNTSTSTGQTIEFRMFRGTLKFETLMASIEFIHNLVNVCKENQASKISWNKVINYSGEYIKEYNDSLDLIDDGLYLRDYTNELENIIDKKAETRKETIDNYKKDLNDISNSLMGIVNEQIDFTSDNTTIQHTINFRNEVFYKLSEVLIDDETDTTNMSLYQRLKTMNKNYDETCRNNLNAIKTTLSTYTRYTLTETTKAHVKETIDLISEKLANETSTTSEC